MKKFILILSIIFAGVFLLGCGGGAPGRLPVLTTPAWGSPDYVREISKYRIQVFAPLNDGQEEPDVLAEGELTVDLTGWRENLTAPVVPEDCDYENCDCDDCDGIDCPCETDSGSATASVSAVSARYENRIRVNKSLYLQWGDDERAGENRTLRETVESEVVFRARDLSPITSNKTVRVGSRRDEDGVLYNNSYRTRTQYIRIGTVNRHSYIEMWDMAAGYFGAERRIGVPAGNIYSNEQLWLLVRGLAGVRPGSGVGLSINNVIENHLRRTSAAIPIQISAQGGLRSMEMPSALNRFLCECESYAECECDSYCDYICECPDPDDCDYDCECEPDDSYCDYICECPDPDDCDYDCECEPDDSYCDYICECPDPDDCDYDCECEPRSIDYMTVFLQLGEALSGPAHRFFVTDPQRAFRRDYTDFTTSRIILGHQIDVHHIDGSLLFRYDYQLIYYSSW